MDARTEILDRIRHAIADAPEVPEVPRNYRRDSTLEAPAVIDLLVDRLEDYKANVFLVAETELAQKIRSLLVDASDYVVPLGLPEAWTAWETDHHRRHVDSPEKPLDVATLDSMGTVITASAVAVAETGTIVLDGSPDQGRRAITLVPDHHICIVRESTVKELVPTAFAKLHGTRPLTMISGPSATSDIELERVEGVHGPRRLDVILVRGV